jgi:hypothetical protein
MGRGKGTLEKRREAERKCWKVNGWRREERKQETTRSKRKNRKRWWEKTKKEIEV